MTQVAVITGAASGIGRALALALAARPGAVLQLLDRDAGALDDTKARCEAAGARVQAARTDVSDAEAVRGQAREAAALGDVGMVMAMAGTIHGGAVLASDLGDMNRVIAVNLTGALNTAAAYLPLLAAGQAGGRLVLCSSGFGVIAAPGYAAYCASKFGVRGLAAALRSEMRAETRGGAGKVTVTCAIPGMVRTPIMRNGTYASGQARLRAIEGHERIALTSAERAATVILRAAERGKPEVTVGVDGAAARMASRLPGVPALLARAVTGGRRGRPR